MPKKEGMLKFNKHFSKTRNYKNKPGINLHENAIPDKDMLVNSHSYLKTTFNGHRQISHAITASDPKVHKNAIVTHPCTKINHPGNKYSRIT